MLLCDICGENPAKIKIENVVGDRREVKYVCLACAKRRADFSGNSVCDKRCRVCGKSFSEITADFSVGCAYCYTEFKNELAPLIEKVQGLS